MEEVVEPETEPECQGTPEVHEVRVYDMVQEPHRVAVEVEVEKQGVRHRVIDHRRVGHVEEEGMVLEHRMAEGHRGMMTLDQGVEDRRMQLEAPGMRCILVDRRGRGSSRMIEEGAHSLDVHESRDGLGRVGREHRTVAYHRILAAK